MSRIVFKGKTYSSLSDMPTDVRQAYEKEQKKERSTETGNKAKKPLTDFVDIPSEVKGMYERALGKADENALSSRPLEDLPETEDIYRQSAPADMKDLPSDESLYRPSQTIVDPMPPTIEPDQGMGMRGLIWGLIMALVLTGIAFVISRFIP